MAVNLPTTLLRSFVAIVDSGSMLGAADRVYLTQSALSLQVKRLEELVQQTLFSRDGRRLTLTRSGEILLGYARRLLSLHDEAIAALNADQFAGPVRIGMVQDFADTLLSGLLAHFGELHPEAQIYARVAGTADLQALLERGQLDVILGFAADGAADAIRVAPMEWYGDPALTGQDVLPLAVLEKPCRFREAAVASLEAAGRPYRFAVESPNLSTLRAAVAAGLGLTCRTQMFGRDLPLAAGAGLPPLAAGAGLPPLPGVACIVSRGRQLDTATLRLADLAEAVVRGL